MILVYGGAASGKSEYAENLTMRLGARQLYIAAMRPVGGQALARMEKHRKMRAGKAFDTVEVYTNADTASLRAGYDAALLECVSNLLANEMFPANGTKNADKSNAAALVLQTVDQIAALYENAVIVSNDVFAGGADYSDEVLEYMRYLGQINAAIARRAGAVAEIVCGLPIVHKNAGGVI